MIGTGWNLFKNHWQATVGSSRLGLLWKILPSLFWCAIFLYIRRGGEGGNAAIGLAVGMVIYQTITDSFRSGSSFFQKNLPLFVQNPKIIDATIINIIIDSVVNCLFKVPIIYGLLILFADMSFQVVWLWMLVALPLMILLSLSLGFVFSFTSYLNRDIAQVSYLVPLLILVFTPIIFVPEKGIAAFVQQINPFSQWLLLMKALLLKSMIPTKDFLLLIFGSIFIFTMTWKFVCYTMPYVAEEAK